MRAANPELAGARGQLKSGRRSWAAAKFDDKPHIDKIFIYFLSQYRAIGMKRIR